MNDFEIAEGLLEKKRIKNKVDLETKKTEITQKLPEYDVLTSKIRLLNLGLIKDIKTISSEKELNIKNEIAILKEKREKLLVDNGYSKDYLELKYNCDICKDVGELSGKVCDCKKDIVNKIRLKKANMYQAVDTETFDNFDLNIFRSEKKETEIISPRGLMELYLQEFKEYSEKFSKNSDSLYVSGNVGVGKTYLCNCISSKVISMGFNVVYMTSAELIQKLRLNVYGPFDKMEENQEKYNLLIEADLLIIDDLGSENITDSSVANLFNLINNRIIVRKPTIISSNIPIDEVARVYDERIGSRIKTFSHHALIGDDLRGRKDS